MKLPEMAFTTVTLSDVAAKSERGETGNAMSRTFEASNIRVRLVDYQPGYLADHWCDRGHVFYLQSGEVEVELQDGRVFPLSAGQSFVVSDHGDSPHRVRSRSGGAAFIVD